MRSSRPDIILFAFLSAGVSVWGQELPDQDTPIAAGSGDVVEAQKPGAPVRKRVPFVRSLAQDEWRMWSSPFRAGNWDSHTVKKYIIPFTLISTGLFITDHRSKDWLPNTDDQTKWSGRVSQAGAAYTLAGFSGATYAVGKLTKNRHAQETGWLALQAVAHSQAIVYVLKQISNRTRPFNYDQQRRGFWRGGDAFPSGHAMTTWAVAAVYTYEYRHNIAVPVAAFSAATLVTLSRPSARRHWLSDIFVGGSMGFLIGRYVYKQHHDPTLPGSKIERRSWRKPDINLVPGGASLQWRF